MNKEKAWELAQVELEFEFSELAGYVGCGILQNVFNYAYNEGYAHCRDKEDEDE
uniref:Uncharacterized protein n=1 Tax=viral metagenome TaxID=1070528 RepID=A0A6M3K1L2_9ZZZZ